MSLVFEYIHELRIAWRKFRMTIASLQRIAG